MRKHPLHSVRHLVIAVASVAAIALAGSLRAAEIDAGTGLVKAQGWELVRAHCGACHSYRLVTAQRGDRNFWLATIRWMQRTQKLWPIEATQEDAILAYLAEHYNETDWGRRPNLPPNLLPGFTRPLETLPDREKTD